MLNRGVYEIIAETIYQEKPRPGVTNLFETASYFLCTD